MSSELGRCLLCHGFQSPQPRLPVPCSLGPVFVQAKGKGDLEAIKAIRDELRSSVSGLFVAFRKALLQPQVRAGNLTDNLEPFIRPGPLMVQVRSFFLASLYEVFELQIACEAEALRLEKMQDGFPPEDGQDSAGIIIQALNHCVKALEEVSPGSDLHAILAARLLHETVQVDGSTSSRAALALEACKKSHLYRYGPTSDELGLRLIELNRTLYD